MDSEELLVIFPAEPAILVDEQLPGMRNNISTSKIFNLIENEVL